MNRALGLFWGACILALVMGHLLRDTPGYMVRNPDGTVTGDITHYVYWTRLVTLGGIQSAYGGTWPETYAVYPPIPLYPYQAVGNAYRWLQDPSFDPRAAQESRWLHEAIKFVALTWHLLTAIAIFLIVRRTTRVAMAAALAGGLYVLNPAAVFDVAHWAQPDGAHGLARGLFAAGVVSLIVVLPFLVTGRVGELLTLPGTVSSVMPVVSADAHNLWWLVLEPRGQDPLFVQDTARALGPLTYRSIAAALVGGILLLTYWLYWTRRASLAEAAALGVLGWFTFTTQAHENHLFFALPLLSLAWPTRRWLLVPFGVITLTLLANMWLHDELLLEALGSGLVDPPVERLRLANAAANVLCCLGWALAAALRPPSPSTASATVTYWRRSGADVGLEMASD